MSLEAKTVTTETMINRFTARLLGVFPRARELSAYLQVSILATFVDIAFFASLLATGLISATIAGSASYLFALIFHYFVAVRFVFNAEQTGKSRARLAAEYIGSGFVGISITAIAIHLLTTQFGGSPYFAKAVGIAFSFFAVYALRSFLVFKPQSDSTSEIRDFNTAVKEAANSQVNYERVRRELATRSHLSMTKNQSIVVLLPCFNEEAAIAGSISAFREALPSATIYVYDNNSTDRTSEVAAAAGAKVRHESLQGKGNVVRRMLADIDADIYVLADGDMTYDATAAGYMVEQLVTRNLDMVVGTRVSDAEAAYRAGHRFGNRLFNVIVQKLFGTQFSDILTGYRVLSRRFAKSFPAQSSGFEIETELSVHALDLRLSTMEIPLHYKARPENSHSKLRTYADGMRIMLTIARMYRWLKPRQFYGGIGMGFAVLSLAFGLPVVLEFWMTGLVPRLPTALLAAAIGQLAVLSLACGLILEAISRGQRELRRMRYLDLAAPDLSPSDTAECTPSLAVAAYRPTAASTS